MQALLLSLFLLLSSWPALAWGQDPHFVHEDFTPSFLGTIERIQENQGGSLIVINRGAYEGFRSGLLCYVAGEGVLKGQVLLVGVSETRSVGLLMGTAAPVALRPGDSVFLNLKDFK